MMNLTPRIRDIRRKCNVICVLLFLLLSASAVHAQADTSVANTALQQGQVEASASLLRAAIAADPHNATAHQLLCRVFYTQEMADPAIHECEAAVANAPTSSDNEMWLGRVYGLKASHAGPFAGLGLARKVRTAFERSVQLDPANVQAASDLGQFYIAAPSIVGGGLDKARSLAAKVQPFSPSRAHRLLALIADDQNDALTAESQFQQAVAASHAPEAYIDLAHFYEHRKQPDKALIAVQAAIAADLGHGPSLVDAASILTAANRAPLLAEKALRDYLSSPAKTDDAPAFRVRMQLARLLAVRGDTSGARREYAAALALAPSFAPARKAAMAS